MVKPPPSYYPEPCSRGARKDIPVRARQWEAVTETFNSDVLVKSPITSLRGLRACAAGCGNLFLYQQVRDCRATLAMTNSGLFGLFTRRSIVEPLAKLMGGGRLPHFGPFPGWNFAPWNHHANGKSQTCKPTARRGSAACFPKMVSTWDCRSSPRSFARGSWPDNSESVGRGPLHAHNFPYACKKIKYR